MAVTLLPPLGLITAGDHVPLMPLFDKVGSVTELPVEHKGPGFVNVGVAAGVTTTVSVVGFAHEPASGVKVAVTLLPPLGSMTAGDHVPLMPLLEVVGSVTGDAL